VTSVISRVGGIATSVWQHDRPLSTPHGIFVAALPRNDGEATSTKDITF
jgi:hypothetical protein